MYATKRDIIWTDPVSAFLKEEDGGCHCWRKTFFYSSEKHLFCALPFRPVPPSRRAWTCKDRGCTAMVYLLGDVYLWDVSVASMSLERSRTPNCFVSLLIPGFTCFLEKCTTLYLNRCFQDKITCKGKVVALLNWSNTWGPCIYACRKAVYLRSPRK